MLEKSIINWFNRVEVGANFDGRKESPPIRCFDIPGVDSSFADLSRSRRSRFTKTKKTKKMMASGRIFPSVRFARDQPC